MKLEYFELLVWLPGRGPYRDLFKGRSLAEALDVARSRHKNCKVEVPAESTPVKLVRSENYGRPTPTRRRRISKYG